MTQAQGVRARSDVPRSMHRSSVAFKEWALVCASMLRGETSLIFRKGGIAEGREGFRFQHERFFLFPTFFHEQAERLRIDVPMLEPEPGLVSFSAYVHVEFTRWIEDLSLLQPLSDLHVLKPEVLEQRFAYADPKGLHLAMIRVFGVIPVWSLAFQKSFGGCRSWVELPEAPAELRFTPVIQDGEHAARVQRVREALGD
ncbi:MAG: DUF1802 family protein [Verrucomicrobia bacterium]|nr:DUF1802 family protein [Verrucomicrobiota bacterium]